MNLKIRVWCSPINSQWENIQKTEHTKFLKFYFQEYFLNVLFPLWTFHLY